MTCLPAAVGERARPGDDTEWIRAVALSRDTVPLGLPLPLAASAHHVGCAVADLDAACASYASALGLARRTRAVRVESQQVEVCFIELRPGFYLELISPLEGNTKLARYLQNGFYHLCFLVEDLEASRAQMKSNRFVPLPAFESEAFGGNLCQFFLSPQAHLVELCQMGEGSFEALFIASLAP